MLKSNTIFLSILIVLTILLTFFLIYLLKRKNKKQLEKIFIAIFISFLISIIPMIFQFALIGKYPESASIYFDYVGYIGVCFLPVLFFIMSLIFARTKIDFSSKYLLLGIVPLLSIILLWTNNYHHLFYIHYSTSSTDVKFGSYFPIHYIYTMFFFALSIIILMKYSVKNSGFFSKQAILIFIGILIPILANVLGFVGIIPGTNITPIALGFTVIFFALAMFRFNLFKVAPIALQRIVDRISDSYVVLNENYEITDYNETFIKTFKIKYTIRGKHFANFLNENGLKKHIEVFAKHLEKMDNSNNIENFELFVSPINKSFNVEITSIVVNKQFIGILVLFKDITQHLKDMQNIKDNQDLLVEQERLASLGQMIGGIAHNLKTPIFSVAGGLEGLSDLVKEFDESIDDDTVTSEDMHDIAKDMKSWISKLKDHVSYMSDVITTVKGQAVNMNDEDINMEFPVSELFQHVNILMQHEVKKELAELTFDNNVDDSIKIQGNINSLVQVVNNLVSNAIEAYSDKSKLKEVIVSADLSVNHKMIDIKVKDFGPGLPKEIQDKLFKEMITTKGKDGTGLGLFMSYSNIKAHFNGKISFETKPNEGTTFIISIPI